MPMTVSINEKESRRVVLYANLVRETIANSQFGLFQHVHNIQVNNKKYLDRDTDKHGERVFRLYLQENGQYLKKVWQTRQQGRRHRWRHKQSWEKGIQNIMRGK